MFFWLKGERRGGGERGDRATIEVAGEGSRGPTTVDFPERRWSGLWLTTGYEPFDGGAWLRPCTQLHCRETKTGHEPFERERRGYPSSLNRKRREHLQRIDSRSPWKRNSQGQNPATTLLWRATSLQQVTSPAFRFSKGRE